MTRILGTNLRFHAAPQPQRTIEKGRRVDFNENTQDRLVLAAVMCGWNIRRIADHLGMTTGQVTYRYSVLCKMKVANYRGGSEVSMRILNVVKNAQFMQKAERAVLRAADITPAMDTRMKTGGLA